MSTTQLIICLPVGLDKLFFLCEVHNNNYFQVSTTYSKSLKKKTRRNILTIRTKLKIVLF